MSKEKISNFLVSLIKAGIFFIIFLPLVMNSRFFFPFIVPKNILFRMAVEVIFASYLILAHLKPEYKPRFNKLVWSVFGFVGISTLAGIFGIGFYSSFWSNYERMSGLFHLYHLAMFFFVLINVFRHKRDWHSFLTFSIFIGALMSLIGFSQWLKIPFLLKSSGGERLTGTVGNATFLAAYLIFNLFFILYFWAKEKRFNIKVFSLGFLVFDSYLVISSILAKLFSQSDWGNLNILKTPILLESFKYPGLFYPFLFFQLLIFTTWFFRSRKNVIRILLSVIFLFDFFIFFNTQTRGAIIGFVAGLFFIGLVSLFHPLDKKIKSAIIVILLCVIALPFILVGNKDNTLIKNNSTLNRLATISLSDITTESRFLTWNASWKGWTESPKSFLIGYGPENYYYAFNKNFPTPIYKDAGSQIWFDRAHNIIFDTGVTTGILGLVAYLSILIFAALFLLKKYLKEKVISSSLLLIGLLIAYFAQNFFVFDTINTEIPFYLFLGFIIFLTSKNRDTDEVGDKSSRDINYIYLAIIGVVLLFGIFGINIKTLMANNYIFQALINKEINGSYNNDSYEYFKKAIDESIVGKFEARQQLANYVNGFVRQNGVAKVKADAMINYSVSELKKSIEEEPLNVRHYLYLSTFYNATTYFNRLNSEKVIDLMNDASKLSPTRPQIYYEIAQAYSYLGDFAKAEEYFSKGLEMSPEVIDDHWNLLTIYIVFGKYDLADEKWQFMKDNLNWKPGQADYQKIVELYGRVKKYDKMIELQSELLKLNETAENYAKLAAIYAKTGENQKAIESTQKAVELNPAFKTEADSFLDLLKKGELLDK